MYKKTSERRLEDARIFRLSNIEISKNWMIFL